MSVLTELDAVSGAEAVRSGRLRSEQWVLACLERIELLDPRIRAFRDITPLEQALNCARELDHRNVRSGALYGVPVAVKEVIDVAELHCTWGSPIHKSRLPRRDAPVVAKLRAAGAVIVGTTISTEYAIAAAGPTTNPHDHLRTPGGSSSGSAAAVAARMVPLALGTQTVGSIVRPATYCGIYGFKPEHGRLDTAGVMPLSSHLDDVGILSRTPADIVLTASVLVEGWNSHANTALPRVLLMYGSPSQCVEPASISALERAQMALEAADVKVVPTQLPADFEQAASCLQTILCRDIAINHGSDRDQAGELMSERMRELVDRGRTVSDKQYCEAVNRSEYYRQSLIELLDQASIIVAPAAAGVAPALDEGTGPSELQALYSLTGMPTLAVPCGLLQGLPVGVQLSTAPGSEMLLFAAANAMRAQGISQATQCPHRDTASCAR